MNLISKATIRLKKSDGLLNCNRIAVHNNLLCEFSDQWWVNLSNLFRMNLMKFFKQNCWCLSWNPVVFPKWLGSLCTGVGVYIWAMVYFKDLKISLKAINKTAGRKKQRIEFRSKLLEITHQHSVAIELSTLCFEW